MGEESKAALGIIDLVKGALARIGVEKDPDRIQAEIDRGILMLEDLDKLLSEEKEERPVPEVTAAEDHMEWHPLQAGNLPEGQSDILFSTVRGQVFEGYREDRDITRAFRGIDGRISFPKADGPGMWYRYHYRDLLPSDLVTAWCYKPQAFHGDSTNSATGAAWHTHGQRGSSEDQ